MATKKQFNDLFSFVYNVEEYPSSDKLAEAEVPFSKQLADLAFNKDKYDAHNEHVKSVVVKANEMLRDGPSTLIAQLADDDPLRRSLDDLFLELPLWANHYKIDRDSIIRAAAVYHDIGKWIIRERHPTEGYYLLQYLFPDETEKLRSMVGSEAFELLLSVIRDHDKFGITSTGEASLAVIVDLLNPARSEEQFYKMAVVTLMLVNLADIAVAAPGAFQVLQARWIVDDVIRILAAIEEGKGNRLRVSRSLLESDSNAVQVTNRIARLVDASYKNAEKVQRLQDKNANVPFDADNWRPIDFRTVKDAVDRKLRVHFLGSAYHRYCSEYAHYCKLDYCLYFFGEVARQLNVRRLRDKQKEYPIDELVGAVILVLKSIVETYAELVKIEQDATAPRRIGIQMQSLLRPGVKETIAGLLAGNIGPLNRDLANVVSWITDEVSAWLFI
jgi:hypothetical protein